MKIAVAGANSSVGLNLLGHVAARDDVTAVAVVRSERAAAAVPAADGVELRVVAYPDIDALTEAFRGADAVVHLAGILIEGRAGAYRSANVDTTASVVEAAERAGARQVVLVGALGADAGSANPFYRSKGEAEDLVRASRLSATILRTPILLGPGTKGAEAVAASAASGTAKLLGGGRHTVRPLDVDDLSRAILNVCGRPPEGSRTYELVGPEPVRYAELIERAATMMGRKVGIRPVPVWAAKLFAGLRYLVTRRGISPAVLEVITSSETVSHNADGELGVTLTPLDETLERSVHIHPAPTRSGRSSAIGRGVFLLITVACFVYLYFRLSGAAAREGLTLPAYMADVFAAVQWGPWLILMMAYSGFYFLIDTLVVSRALNWFVAEIRYRDILPIRASAYIISVFNEQIGKGAMAYYLNRRDGVPGWEVTSVMLFVMFCEFFYLLTWATVGYFLTSSALPDVFVLIPYIAAAGAVVFGLWVLYFRGVIFQWFEVRRRRLLHAFRRARLRHYAGFFLLRSPALLGAVFVYTTALRLFGVEASFLEMLGYLPVIFFAAAVPTPMRAAAITLWVVLFPENEGQMAAFGFVQHNFFILFNALIGLLFWRRAQRDLFGPARG